MHYKFIQINSETSEIERFVVVYEQNMSGVRNQIRILERAGMMSNGLDYPANVVVGDVVCAGGSCQLRVDQIEENA